MAERCAVQSPAHTTKCTAVLSYWYKKVGDTVRKGEDLLDYEADKATVTLEAPCAGRLVEITVPEDGIVEPEMVLGYIESVDAGEESPA